MTSTLLDLATRILDDSPDAIVVCDAVGRIRRWNRGAQRVFGFSPAEAVDASLDLIIPERLRTRHWAGWHTAITAGQTRFDDGQILAVPALRKDGSLISIEFSIQFVKDRKGHVEAIVAIIRDVTERYSRDKALRAELKALQVRVQRERHEA
jgi:PAS domain S-box-containing protein